MTKYFLVFFLLIGIALAFPHPDTQQRRGVRSPHDHKGHSGSDHGKGHEGHKESKLDRYLVKRWASGASDHGGHDKGHAAGHDSGHHDNDHGHHHGHDSGSKGHHH